MIKELDSIVMITDLEEQGLKAGDLGTVVLIHGDREGYEVEFVTLDGETVAVVSVYPPQVRPVQRGEIAHARPPLPSATCGRWERGRESVTYT